MVRLGFILANIKYTDEFKADAVSLVKSGMTQTRVSKDLGVSIASLNKWVRDAGLRSAGMTPSRDAAENAQMAGALRRIRELEMENEVLRRAAAYL